MPRSQPGKLPGYLLSIGVALFCLLGWLGGTEYSLVLADQIGAWRNQGSEGSNSPGTWVATQVFVNEIHYDNSGTDINEGVELAGPAGTDLTGWRLALYNGNGGAEYANVPLSGVIPNLGTGFGCVFIPVVGLQNGAPDGIALVNANGTVVQFLSYEGILAAVDGPGAGFLSTDIGVEENGADPLGYSLQIRGSGNMYEDFTWSGPVPATPGDANTGQEFLPASPAATPQIAKISPSYVAPGAFITYTLVVQNLLGYPLHQVTITDAVPSEASFAYALDGGQETHGVVTWVIDWLEHGASLERRWVAVAPVQERSLVTNQRYAVSALEWETPVSGETVYTTVGSYTPIPAIQGRGSVSSWRGRPAITQGVVTGFFQGNYLDGAVFNGFFLQDLYGDSDPHTSDGLFVHTGNGNISVSPGDLLEVGGMVQEFDEYGGFQCPSQNCLTVISIAGSASVRSIDTGTVSSSSLDPPGDPTLATAYFEAREGMLVHLPVTATVTGPTSFGTLFVVPGDEDVERVLRGSPQEGMTFGVRHWERAGDIEGQNAPGLITGSVVEAMTGPLTWSYGDYLVVTQAGKAWRAIEACTPPGNEPNWPAPGPDEFSVATFNADKLNGWGIQYTKVISAILAMHGPTFLALQEVNPYTVFPSLATRLESQGYGYGYAYSHPDSGGFGVALLWRTETVEDVSWSTQYQACSPNGSPSSTYDDLWETCRSQGEYPLFARRPLVISGTLHSEGNSLPIVLIANHFKSRLEGESVEQRRWEEAHFVGQLAGELSASGAAQVIVLGDLNDFEDSPPLQALYNEGRLETTWDKIPPENHYSFIYQGVSQVLDHILVSPDLLRRLEAVAPLHVNADFPYSPFARDSHTIWRSSDHDPVAALFRIHLVNRVFLPVLAFEH